MKFFKQIKFKKILFILALFKRKIINVVAVSLPRDQRQKHTIYCLREPFERR